MTDGEKQKRNFFMKHFIMTAICLIAGLTFCAGSFADSAKKENVSAQPLFIQTDLNRGGKEIDGGVRRVETDSENASGVATGSKKVSGESSYTVSFDARGNHNLIIMVTGGGIKRIDPFKSWQPLSDDWKSFKTEFNLPASAKSMNFRLFYWKQPGKWFEIRNFKVVPR